MKVIILLGLLGVVLGNDVDHATMEFDSNNDDIIWLNEMMDVFKTLDKNEDGQLTLEEFTAEAHSESSRIEAEKVFKLLDTMDLETNGMLDKSAFVAYYTHLDSNEDGQVTPTEYRENSSSLFNLNDK